MPVTREDFQSMMLQFTRLNARLSDLEQRNTPTTTATSNSEFRSDQSTPGSMHSDSVSALSSSTSKKHAARSTVVMSRAAEANATKLGLDKAELAKLNAMLEDDAAGASGDDAAAGSGDDADYSNDKSQVNTNTPFLTALMPSKFGEQQDVSDLLLASLQAKAKAHKKFASFEQMLLKLDQQLEQFITADKRYSSRIKAFQRYQRFLITLYTEKGLDGVNFYHWRLFDQIQEQTWSLTHDGSYNAQLMRDLDAMYATVTPIQSKKKAGAGGSASGSGGNRKRTAAAGTCPAHPKGNHGWATCVTNPARATTATTKTATSTKQEK
jgi:hypothetical protein